MKSTLPLCDRLRKDVDGGDLAILARVWTQSYVREVHGWSLRPTLNGLPAFGQITIIMIAIISIWLVSLRLSFLFFGA